jgi:hypothetical protein
MFSDQTRLGEDMKSIFKTIATLLIAAALLMPIGCKKIIYEKLLEDTWRVITYYKNGDDNTSSFFILFQDYTLTFHPDGAFTETTSAIGLLPVTNTGTWELMNNATQLTLIDSRSTRTFDIIKLTKAELNISRDLSEGGDEEYVLIPKE